MTDKTEKANEYKRRALNLLQSLAINGVTPAPPQRVRCYFCKQVTAFLSEHSTQCKQFIYNCYNCGAGEGIDYNKVQTRALAEGEY